MGYQTEGSSNCNCIRRGDDREKGKTATGEKDSRETDRDGEVYGTGKIKSNQIKIIYGNGRVFDLNFRKLKVQFFHY